MKQEIVRNERIGEEYLRIEHPSGLTMLLYPMKGFSTSYAMFSTKYGSIDVCFKTEKDKDFVTVPAGIAHYLEHKMFESEDGDAFDRYAKTGASANAFTSFDKTCYLFACSDQFRESIEILLDFVTDPYFTKETVEKEQGIIAQEIRMYDDDPGWRVMFNLLESMYQKNSVKVDIAGTVESIAQIDADLLYRCYNTFYNLNNMVLTVAGNFDPQDVIDAADEVLKKAEPIQIERKVEEEPAEVARKRFVQHLPVATPMFYIGFKSPNAGETQNFRNMIYDEMILDLVTGETTELYKKLYEQGLINGGIIGETMAGRDYLCSMISGESKDPDSVYEQIAEAFEQAKMNGIADEDFERIKKSTYGRYLGMFGKPESIAAATVNCYFAGMDLYELIELVANSTKEELMERLKADFLTENSSISIVMA